MFKKEMAEKLSRIFGLPRVSYSEPGDTFEQDALFVGIQESKSNAGQGRVSAKVTGTLTVFAQNNELSYGFFNKKISQAVHADTKQFFFFDIDQEVLNSPARIQNISERRVSFIYLFNKQYDPNQGELTELELVHEDFPISEEE